MNISLPTILILLGALISASGIFLASIEQTEKEKSLRLQAEELNKKSSEIMSQITGGNSFPEIYFFNADNDSFQESVALSINGKYPLYDISIDFWDVDAVNNYEKQNGLDIGIVDLHHQIEFGNVNPNLVVLTGIKLEKRKTARLNFNVMSRNGNFLVKTRVALVKGKYLKATIVKAGDTVLLKKIDVNYPSHIENDIDFKP